MELWIALQASSRRRASTTVVQILGIIDLDRVLTSEDEEANSLLRNDLENESCDPQYRSPIVLVSEMMVNGRIMEYLESDSNIDRLQLVSLQALKLTY